MKRQLFAGGVKGTLAEKLRALFAKPTVRDRVRLVAGGERADPKVIPLRRPAGRDGMPQFSVKVEK